MKYVLVRRPRSEGVSANSRTRSLAMTALTLRKKYERKKPAANGTKTSATRRAAEGAPASSA